MTSDQIATLAASSETELLAQEVTWGMREVALRGFFLGFRTPFGYRRIKVKDGAKELPHWSWIRPRLQW